MAVVQHFNAFCILKRNRWASGLAIRSWWHYIITQPVSLNQETYLVSKCQVANESHGPPKGASFKYLPMVAYFVCIHESITKYNLKNGNNWNFSCRWCLQMLMYNATSVFLNEPTRNEAATRVFSEVLLKCSFNSLMFETSPGQMPVLITWKL